MQNVLNRTLNRLMQLTYIVGAISVALMMIHLTVHIVSLYLFSFPLPGTYLIIANYYMVIVTFLCMGLAEYKGAHISVDFVYDAMPAGLKRVADAITLVLTVGVFSAMGWRGLESAISKTRAGSYDLEYGIKFLTWPSYYLVPVGCGLVVLVVLMKAFNRRGRTE